MPMKEREFIQQNDEDLEKNPNARIAVALCLDNSGSMAGEPIVELNEGIKVFYEAVLADDLTKYAVEICTVSFDTEAVLVQDFGPIQEQTVPALSTRGGATHIAAGVNLALDMLEQRKEKYKKKGVDHYQPWLVLMTDGKPVGETESVLRDAMERTSQLVHNRKLTVFPVGIGNREDSEKYQTLKGFSPKVPPIKLQGVDFREFFEWLSKSVAEVPMSNPGDKIKITEPPHGDWEILI